VPSPADSPFARPRGLPPRTLGAVAERLGLPLPGDAAADTDVTGITSDSRAVRPGDLYAALPGSRAHGAGFATAAREAGAVAVVTDLAGARPARAAGLPAFVVDNPRDAVGALAAWVYGEPARDLQVIGVTGTNGKTTTTYLLEAGLRATGHRTGLVGTIETRIGDETVPSVRTTPEATDLQALLAVMRERGVDAVAMEVSSHALALGRVDGTSYDVAVFTNLTEDHLDFHADLDDYFSAKAALFTPGRSRVAVVNIDDGYGERLAADIAIPVVTVSPGGRRDAAWRAEKVEVTSGGSTFRLVGPDGVTVDGATALVGAFNVDNAVLAVVALVQAGADPAAAAKGVADCAGIPGRMERVAAGQDFLALVDYAHSPDALERLLAAARGLTQGGSGRVLLVVGCGGDRDRHKRSVMGEIAARGADVAVLTNDNPRSEDPQAILAALKDGAMGAGGPATVEVVPDRKAAIEKAVGLAGPGDVVVVAGKGHEQGQETAGVVQPFDDRAVLRAAIAAAR
jgi:UDP-N-acetylmuramoyl-L-alanyl-D-glutamate--2,6-diaminopimelate ligase